MFVGGVVIGRANSLPQCSQALESASAMIVAFQREWLGAVNGVSRTARAAYILTRSWIDSQHSFGLHPNSPLGKSVAREHDGNAHILLRVLLHGNPDVGDTN